MFLSMKLWILAALLSFSVAFPTIQQRLTLAEWTSYSFRDHKGPGTYAFGYDIEDPITNNVQFRQEERHANGTVVGSYGYVEPNGHVRIVHYIADHLGYRTTEESPPSLHPHHKPPSTTTVTPTQDDQQIFEGEFYPNFDPDDNEIHLEDTEPIQFPSAVQLPPPVYENPLRQKQHGLGVGYQQPKQGLPVVHKQRTNIKQPTAVYQQKQGPTVAYTQQQQSPTIAFLQQQRGQTVSYQQQQQRQQGPTISIPQRQQQGPTVAYPQQPLRPTAAYLKRQQSPSAIIHSPRQQQSFYVYDYHPKRQLNPFNKNNAVDFDDNNFGALQPIYHN